MCPSAYDLVYDKCRVAFDEIFGDEECKTAEEERQKTLQWINRLCPQCRSTLKEEGFLEPIPKPSDFLTFTRSFGSTDIDLLVEDVERIVRNGF